MLKHVVLYTLKEEYQGEEKAKILNGIKTNLEGLKGKIPGLVEMNILTDKVSGNMDYMLDSVFSDEQALKDYKEDPLHLKVAETCVRPYIDKRAAFNCNI